MQIGKEQIPIVVDKSALGMSESGGVFTFPSTGIYQVTAMILFKRNSGENRFADLNIQVTTDNSSFNTAAFGSGSFAQAIQQI